MAALDYAGLMDALTALLSADARLDGVHVTQEPDPPATEWLPAVLVSIVGFDREPRQLVGMTSAAAPYFETVTIELQCWDFSAHGIADAQRRRDALVRSVEQVVADNPTLSGTVLLGQVLRGTFKAGAVGQGIQAMAALTLQAQALT